MILALKRLRQDHHGFEASLGYLVSETQNKLNGDEIELFSIKNLETTGAISNDDYIDTLIKFLPKC